MRVREPFGHKNRPGSSSKELRGRDTYPYMVLDIYTPISFLKYV